MKRTIRPGDRGPDVRYAQRLLAKNKFFREWYSGKIDGVFGEGMADAVRDAKYDLGYPDEAIVPAFGSQLEKFLLGTERLPRSHRWRRRGRARKPRLVEPRQGWGSLDRSLWEAYSIGINRKFLDLGTYVDKPGDHGVGPPALAFDLGRRDRFFFRGWDYLRARALVKYYVKHHQRLNINYVILGRRIWSRSKPYWHALTTGDTSHDFHIHVSGVR